MKALIIVDIQNDFTSGGALPVPGGDTIIGLANQIQQKFELVVATQDWHPKGHRSFASAHPGHQVFDKVKLYGLDQTLWPDHCLQGSPGAEFHPDLDTRNIEAIFRKGTDPSIDSYSGFYDNGHRKSTGLSGYLKDRNISDVYVCGLAGDFCVYFTALDSLREGFNTFLVEDTTRSIDAAAFEIAKYEIQLKGGQIIQSPSIPELLF
jgi:nicotinamidase/pyrazinamidase